MLRQRLWRDQNVIPYRPLLFNGDVSKTKYPSDSNYEGNFLVKCVSVADKRCQLSLKEDCIKQNVTANDFFKLPRLGVCVWSCSSILKFVRRFDEITADNLHLFLTPWRFFDFVRSISAFPIELRVFEISSNFASIHLGNKVYIQLSG